MDLTFAGIRERKAYHKERSRRQEQTAGEMTST